MPRRKASNGARWRRAYYKRPKHYLDPHQLMEALELQDDPQYFDSLTQWVLYAAYKFLNMRRSAKRQKSIEWANFQCYVLHRFHFLCDYQEWWPIGNLIEPHLVSAYDPQREERVRRTRDGNWDPPPNPPVRTKHGKRVKKKPSHNHTRARAAAPHQRKRPANRNSGGNRTSPPANPGPPSGKKVEVVIPRFFDTPARHAQPTPLLRPPDVWVEVIPRPI